MQTAMTTKSLNQLSISELEAVLKNKKALEEEKLKKEKFDYERSRDEKVLAMITRAKTLFNELGEFKKSCHTEMDNQAIKLSEYGKIRSNSKGGFSISDQEDTMRIKRRRDTEPYWDERSSKAIALIKEFLSDTIKKRDVKLHEILLSFLERNANGDLEYSRVMDLYKHEDKFEDSRWKEGLRLIKESFSNHLKGYGYEFKYKDETGHWQQIVLNFSGL
jgi:ribosomal protein L31E